MQRFCCLILFNLNSAKENYDLRSEREILRYHRLRREKRTVTINPVPPEWGLWQLQQANMENNITRNN